MDGDERVRHCSVCRLNVYNLSEMSGEEAETFLRQQLGRVCVRYFQRIDGTVMTKDCPRGLKSLRKRAVKRLALAASLALTSISCGTHGDRIKKATGLDIFDRPKAVVGALPDFDGRLQPPPSSSPTTGTGTTAPVNGPSTKLGEIARQ